MLVQVCASHPSLYKSRQYAPKYLTKVTIVDRTFVRELCTITEVNEESEDTQTPPALISTPYFTPESPQWMVDPNSPPENPTNMELAYMIAARIPPRFMRAQPDAPQPPSVRAFPSFLGYDLTSARAWGNMLKLGMFSESRRRLNSGVGLGLDVPGLGDKELSLSSCPQAVRL
ncbi:hypothetical protein PHLGIDRAFT_393059 [Phlebiopsis gigantea 11061_1 CR5-6]|uniref:Uncharacterized protein n=1 Tax=Phlebiopsis gigantea (strain 11061_1 CR5-6) TaxID=745531 RepID=A0A0C3S955_PHLG1|nr:hypothetical protein PHLGIDRAFT_393059 [Phlebiopsis gigantea 11061_1 CR5-6]